MPRNDVAMDASSRNARVLPGLPLLRETPQDDFYTDFPLLCLNITE